MRVIVSGGGTGGHIYPALAIIREIKQREANAEFLYIGTERGLENDIVSKMEIPFATIEISGFQRKLSVQNLKTVYRFLKGVRDSKQKIRGFRPDIVIGTGGYVCGPVVYAASRLNIPTLVHEQNVIPGLTNAFLSRYTDAVAVSFAASAGHFHKARARVELTGNPRASEVSQADGVKGRASLQIPKNKKVVMIVGGSRGAKAINQAFMGMVDRTHHLLDCHFIYVTGEAHYEEIRHDLRKRNAPLSQITLKPFIYNMPDVLAGTDLIVNRAGASFLSEITALGLPSILVPSPYVTNQHQEKNARWLEQEGASQVILEKELTGSVLFDQLYHLLEDDERLRRMKQASARLGLRDASLKVYQLVKKLVG